MKLLNLTEYDNLSCLQKVAYFETFFPSQRVKPLKLVQGVGNYNSHVTTKIAFRVNGDKFYREYPCFAKWRDMLRRCYNIPHQNYHPTYSGVSVCGEWLTFSNFRVWWLDNYVEGWELDKDLLSENRQYSPDNCVYIPQWLNKFTTDCGKSRGKYLIGCHREKSSKKFRALLSINGKSVALGAFPTEQEAHQVWREAKLKQVLSKKAEIDLIDTRLYPNIVKIISNLK